MLAPSLRHGVLVTHPMPASALARLRIFFDVETQFGNPLPGSDALLQWLHGKAGVIADTRYRFDAALLLRLPALKAICHLGGASHKLDLQALTKAGIRATQVPTGEPSQRTRWSRQARLAQLVVAADPAAAGDIAAEELIAALGFGRNSWHPRYLLNTDVSCESCC